MTLKKVTQAWKRAEGNNKPMTLKWQVSYNKDEDKARAEAHEYWKINLFGNVLSAQLRTPFEFEQVAAHVTPEEMSSYMFIANDPQKYIDKIKEFYQMGFEKIDIHSANTNQAELI